MTDTIIKRDGREVSFDAGKITAAILKAFQASGSAKSESAARKLTDQVVAELNKNESINIPNVEDIQDTVERVLIDNGYVRTAKSYILYRAERSRVREMNTRLMRIYDDITNTAATDSDIKRENANINGDTAMGAMLKYGSEGAKQFNQMFIIKPEHADAHRRGDFHIHDMDFLTLTTTCCQIDLLELFKNGFSTGHGYLREPKDIYSYSALACIAIQANQNDQHGGQSVVNFDYSMAEGVKNKLGISVNETNVEMIPAYAAAGFEVMEISLPNKPHEEIVAFGERALELAKECGMQLWSVHIPFGRSLEISSIDEAKRLNVLSMLMPSVALARKWGAQVLVVHASSEPNEPSSRPARILACAESLKTLQRAAAPVRVALENLPRTCIGRESCEVVPLAKYCSGVCFDVNHLLIESHEDFMKEAAPFIITTHLSDYDGEDEKHWMPGAGIVPWKQVYDTLTAAGYEGPWLFELGRNPDGTNFDPVAVLDSWAKESGL